MHDSCTAVYHVEHVHVDLLSMHRLPEFWRDKPNGILGVGRPAIAVLCLADVAAAIEWPRAPVPTPDRGDCAPVDGAPVIVVRALQQ